MNPIEIAANAVSFLILFWQARLYGDMALQVLFIAICFVGWYRWLYDGEGRSTLHVSRITVRSALFYAVAGAAATAFFTPYLRSVGDAAPFRDALTTVLSVEAQYLMTRKVIEHWLMWMIADVAYVWVYAERGLYLTSLLYVIFFAMCVAGWFDRCDPRRMKPGPCLAPRPRYRWTPPPHFSIIRSATQCLSQTGPASGRSRSSPPSVPAAWVKSTGLATYA